jgi:hypothetical protein
VNLAALPVALAIGDSAGAEAHAASALLQAETLADDPWWDSSPELRAVRDAAVERLTFGPDRLGAWSVALLAGNADRARMIAGELPPDQQPLASMVIDAWIGAPGGRSTLERFALDDPLGRGPGWAALVAARDGDEATASRFRRLAAIAYGSTLSGSGFDVVVTTDPPLAQPPGPNAPFHFRYVYHRSVPAGMLVPGLPQIDLR